MLIRTSATGRARQAVRAFATVVLHCTARVRMVSTRQLAATNTTATNTTASAASEAQARTPDTRRGGQQIGSTVDGIHSIAFSPDGRTLAAVGEGNTRTAGTYPQQLTGRR